MADEPKSKQELINSFPDNDQGLITEQDMRNFVESVFGVYGGMYKEDFTFDFPGQGDPILMDDYDQLMPTTGVTSSIVDGSTTIETDGVYQLQGEICMDAPSPGLGVEFQVNGVAVATAIPIDGNDFVSINTLQSLSADDTIELYLVETNFSSSNQDASRVAYTVKRIG